MLSEKVAEQTTFARKQVGSCKVCERRAELEKVKGYAFEMCPHCAYMTKMHAAEKATTRFANDS